MKILQCHTNLKEIKGDMKCRFFSKNKQKSNRLKPIKIFSRIKNFNFCIWRNRNAELYCNKTSRPVEVGGTGGGVHLDKTRLSY